MSKWEPEAFDDADQFGLFRKDSLADTSPIPTCNDEWMAFLKGLGVGKAEARRHHRKATAMRVTKEQAVDAAAQAGDLSMRAAGRTTWNEEDFNAAERVRMKLTGTPSTVSFKAVQLLAGVLRQASINQGE